MVKLNEEAGAIAAGVEMVGSPEYMALTRQITNLAKSYANEKLLKQELGDHIKLSSLAILMVRRRMYIVDPRRVPKELKDKNILEVQDPIQVTAVTTDGREIPVILQNIAQQLVINTEVVGPDEE